MNQLTSRRVLPLLLAVLLTVAITGCSPSGAKADHIRIAGLKGATSIGLLQLMDSADQKKTANQYSFGIYATADEVTPKLIQGDLDIAAVPANLASVLYNNTKGEVALLAINTLGVLYLVETGDTIHSFADLKGKTILASGKGSAPEYSLRYLLVQNGINPDSDLTIEWKSEPTEIVSAMASSDNVIAMLPQPYVTIAMTKVTDLKVAMDLSEEWEKTDSDSQMVTGVLVIRKDFAEKYPQQVAKFLEEYQDSANFANENVKETALLSEVYGLFPAAIAEKAIPECHITCISGTDMRPAMEGYLRVLYEQNPKSVGGKLPGEDFYYQAQ